MAQSGPGIAQIEAVERDACADLYVAAPPATADALGLRCHPVAGGIQLVCRALDNLVFNRLVGLPDTLAAEDLDASLARFDAAGVRDWAVQLPPDAERLAALCTSRGLAPRPRVWTKFLRPATDPLRPATDLAVVEADAGRAGDFAAVVRCVYGLPEVVDPWLAALVGRPSWRVFLACDGATAVGAGALYIGDGLGWLGFGATLPEARARGAQSALLAARIAAGREAGLVWLTTETGRPLPGEPAPSFRNITRAGFAEAYDRRNFHRPAAEP
jgi:hypothetical protein